MASLHRGLDPGACVAPVFFMFESIRARTVSRDGHSGPVPKSTGSGFHRGLVAKGGTWGIDEGLSYRLASIA